MHVCLCVWVMTVCGHQALDALDKALQQNPSDLTLRAELHFSKGNQLREMNQLDQAFQVRPTRLTLPPLAPRCLSIFPSSPSFKWKILMVA